MTIHFAILADHAARVTIGGPLKATCPIHGQPRHRRTCRPCNAAYMRDYLQARRRQRPELELLRRAEERAARLGLDFRLEEPLALPQRCPALGMMLTPGGRRRSTSPSLDRIDPRLGYIPDNVRIICDRANRLKGDRTLEELRALSIVGVAAHRWEFVLIARYVEREAVLADVRKKAALESRPGEWAKLADFLDKALAAYGQRHG